MNELFGGRVASMDFSWITDPSSYDPSYPFVAYSYLVLIAISYRVYVISRPLLDLYYRFTRKRLKGMLNDAKEILSTEQKKQLNLFILSELIILVFPAFIAIITRIILGQPMDFTWTVEAIIAGVILALLWFGTQIWLSKSMRDFLLTLDRLKYNPLVVDFALSGVNRTKKKLEKIVEFEPKYVVRDEDEIEPLRNPLDRDKYGKIILDMEVTKSNLRELGKKSLNLAHNTKELAKSSVQKISQNALETIEDKVQTRVDDFTTISLKDRILDKSVILFLSLGPLFVIYLLLPWLG
tara:strand:+ start:977 stop:1861 length:885 start_codon:yes stop_codon:yes gene_type:complete